MRNFLLIVACFGVLVLTIGYMNVSGSKVTHASLLQASSTIVHTAVPAIARHLVRINQLDPHQYISQEEYTTWSWSACSTAAMTEVLNTYGHTYRIHDILAVERAVGEITIDAGLLHPGGIERTVAQFGFSTDWGYQHSLDQIVATANRGISVIVGFPPQAAYPTGHLLVVVGGNTTTIFLADSSSQNLPSLSRTTFRGYWHGFSAIVTPTRGGQR